ncbi:Ca-activated chloride channel family protein [Algoriphagus boseongensis]|uniref:Ca-activated chloride channel family protein n=1 Tax=Algoriphagus boseongensis TaxID=1442587 RepID=A0A4R6TB86_9BACT|nr:VWA domain-containing protein [Algoriphagus boseongensis]TDQ19262.1 Ca-activated chloride channel family protein [Algoriphagus boseongensis]
MIWAYPDIRLIILLGGAFILLYIFYISRFLIINRKLKVEKQRLFTKLILRTLYFILFLIALAGPSIGNSFKEIQEEGKDIFIAVDLSQSMIATDIGPNRLARIQFELKELLKSFPSDRIGLIIFSTEAFMQLPLTYDQAVINLYIDGLNIGLVPNLGTDLNTPLRLALDKFEKDESQEVKSKAIILISDGEHFGDDLDEITERLEENGVKVFSLGIGTESGGQMPRGNGVVIDPQTGQPALTKLDKAPLQYIASQTGGEYFEISDEAQEMGSLISSLESLEGGVANTRTVEASSNKYFYFLLAALGLAMMDMILPVKTIKL